MTSKQIRDPGTDALLTPGNAAVVIIDYQPVQVNSINSMDRQLLVTNIVGVAKIARTYQLPIVHSTVNVETGLNKPPPSRNSGRSSATCPPTTAPRSTPGRTRSSPTRSRPPVAGSW
ncbi:hypothetical protein ABT324_22760 [Saccharopolyspora sp. NPDC000359]|uniref:hypothetical protein n=1 Tax=Saccharopolyspora sp. NPDC000359 TaxID=3154251 RepID=UPI003326F3E8